MLAKFKKRNSTNNSAEAHKLNNISYRKSCVIQKSYCLVKAEGRRAFHDSFLTIVLKQASKQTKLFQLVLPRIFYLVFLAKQMSLFIKTIK